MFEIEDELECPHCGVRNFISTVVPPSAWQPGGAYFTEDIECPDCEEKFEIEARVESSLDLV